MAWNYRVLKEEVNYNDEKLDRFKIIEVYYDEAGNIKSWCDCSETILNWTGENAYEDLKGSAEYVLGAFKKPVLIKGEDEKLFEQK